MIYFKIYIHLFLAVNRKGDKDNNRNPTVRQTSIDSNQTCFITTKITLRQHNIKTIN